MSANQLMADLDRLGIRIEPQGDQLRFSPRRAVTPELAERMKEHKAEILTLLKGKAHEGKAQLKRIPEDDRDAIPDTSKADAWIDRIAKNWDSLPERVSTHDTSKARPLQPGECPRCRSKATIDVVLDLHPHNGRTTRRDCKNCGRFIEWARWYAHPPGHGSSGKGAGSGRSPAIASGKYTRYSDFYPFLESFL